MKKDTLLLHTCCAPCLIYPFEALKEKYDVTVLYYNPNIHPQKEYKIRLKALKKYCFDNKINIIVDRYTPADYYREVRGMEADKKKRCAECYKVRIRRTAQHAARLGIKNISTSLMVSPYQDLAAIKKVGQGWAQQFAVNFVSGDDWSKHFKVAQDKAKELGMYRQKYCGCTFSQEEVK